MYAAIVLNASSCLKTFLYLHYAQEFICQLLIYVKVHKFFHSNVNYLPHIHMLTRMPFTI